MFLVDELGKVFLMLAFKGTREALQVFSDDPWIGCGFVKVKLQILVKELSGFTKFIIICSWPIRVRVIAVVIAKLPGIFNNVSWKVGCNWTPWLSRVFFNAIGIISAFIFKRHNAFGASWNKQKEMFQHYIQFSLVFLLFELEMSNGTLQPSSFSRCLE